MKLKYKPIYTQAVRSYESLSTCNRLHVAALLVQDGRIVSVGYNGVPSGQKHCCDIFIKTGGKFYVGEWGPPGEMSANEVTEEEWKRQHHMFSERYEVHAEMNCIAFATKNRIDVSKCNLIISISPCINCAKLITAVGIKKVYYLDEYDRSQDGINYLRDNGVICEKVV